MVRELPNRRGYVPSLPILEAMGRKPSLRTISINGATFRWKADWAYIEGRRTIWLRVWGGDKTSQALHAHLVATFHGFHATVERGEVQLPMHVEDTTYIQPREVRTVIEYGLSHGWNPQASGKPFCLSSADVGPSADLALVDIQ